MRAYLLSGLASLAFATVAQAQSVDHTLPNGQRMVLPSAVAGCNTPVPLDGEATMGADLTCRVGATTGAPPTVLATVAVLGMKRPSTVTPRHFLILSTESWWPDDTPEQRGARITTRTKTLASGPARFLCVHRDDVPNLTGDALCALDAPTIQFMAAGHSTMASTADDAVDTVLAAVTLL